MAIAGSLTKASIELGRGHSLRSFLYDMPSFPVKEDKMASRFFDNG